ESKEKIRKHFLIKFSAPSGVLIWHPYRLKPGYEDEYKEYLRKSVDGLKKWEWIRSKSNWREMVTYSPHFHFVGYVGYLKQSEKGEGWLYKTIEETKNGSKVVSVLSYQDVYRVVNYLLTHVGTLSNQQHSYSWLGNISNNSGKTEVAQEAAQDPMDVIMSISADGAKKSPGTDTDIKKKIECKWCKEHNKQGKLRYFGNTFIAALNAHEIGVEEDLEYTDWDAVSNQVKKLDIPNFQKLHLLEAIKVKQKKPPPLGWETYLIKY
ncbi:unnamed protein product, partial [marine sediment metagenome]